jgi:diadenosine tetraphosphate (Ap4A) HIT family hydrolase
MNCELCAASDEVLLWGNKQCRVILANDADYPGFCRVIWNEHIKEMSDLDLEGREFLMNTVFAVEHAVREVMQPLKINLASLGNVTPHLHWHVIPRYLDDKHYPNPIWGQALRKTRISNITDISKRLSTSIQEMLTA